MNRYRTIQQGAGARQRGFTLIELMITVAIIAILAAVAFPAYTSQIAKGRRAEAKAMVLEASQWMERYYAENNRYDKNTANVAVDDTFNNRFKQSPRLPNVAMYNLALSNLGQNTYTITATRTGKMTGDACGDFSITQLAAPNVANYNATKYSTADAALLACWK